MAAKLRKIPLRKTTLKIRKPDGTENIFDYKEHLIGALNSPPIDDRTGQPRGFGPSEMRRRISVIKHLEGNEDFVLLDNSDYNELKAAVLAQKWAIVDEAITDYTDAVEKAEEVEAEEKKCQ
jgi:hypothetical protein